MTEPVITAMISALATVICAWIAYQTSKSNKASEKYRVEESLRSKKRSEEAKLQLAMLSANTKLCIGTAMAVKNGHANGELEEGLRAVKRAEEDYEKFLADIALDQIRA